MAHRLHVRITGRVQGVGFRYCTREQATALGLTGWVRNCADGAVEAEFEGDRATLKDMLAWCERGPLFSSVTGVEAEWDEGPAQYTAFQIRF